MPPQAWPGTSEFLREGFAVQDTLRPDRIVVGVTEDAADVTLRAVYASVLELGTPYITTDLATAELVKVAANAFLATKISFINAVANVCRTRRGADVMTLADASSATTPGSGRRFLVRRARLRRRLPAQGHPGLHGPRRRAGRG